MIPATTVHPIASSSFSIAKNPLPVLVSFCDDYVFLCSFAVHTSARSRVAVLDAPPQHFARLAAFALTEPLAIPPATSPYFVLDLPEHLEQ